VKKIEKIKILSVVKSTTEKQRPRLEFSPDDLERLSNVAQVILAIVGVLGVATVALIAPNVLSAAGKLFAFKKSRHGSFKEKQEKIAKAFYYLKKSGAIRLKAEKTGIKVWLTQLGKKKFKKQKINACFVKKQAGWNGKWWLVAADIPTIEYRKAADMFRRKIKHMGFYSLQRTLWIYPFDPIQEVQFVADYYGISRFLTIMEINRMDIQDEDLLKKFFKKNKVI